MSGFFPYICRQIILEPDRLYSAITWILQETIFCTRSEGRFHSYSIHVIAECNLSGSKIICPQIYHTVFTTLFEKGKVIILILTASGNFARSFKDIIPQNIKSEMVKFILRYCITTKGQKQNGRYYVPDGTSRLVRPRRDIMSQTDITDGTSYSRCPDQDIQNRTSVCLLLSLRKG